MYLYQPVHVAAQYGETTFLNHIVGRYGADIEVPDKDGRHPLHWYVENYSDFNFKRRKKN